MFYFIYPIDETTDFLQVIPEKIIESLGEEYVNVKRIFPNEDSYSEGVNFIENLPEKSVVIFMGHGQADILWGAENNTFDKKPFLKKTDSKVFANKYIFLLSCNSNEFLKGTFGFSKILNSIGFGSLPTEMSEIDNNKKLKSQGVNQSVIDSYKEVMIELISLSLCDMKNKNLSFPQLSNIFLLRLNKKISEVILQDVNNPENRILSNLLFLMKAEFIYI